MIDLKNTNIIITGATGGIGKSIVEKLYNLNANIIAIGTTLDKLNFIKSRFNNVSTIKFDISNHDKLDQLIEDCDKIFENKIDILINNAGITSDNLSLRMKNDEWNKVINLNLTSSFLLSKNAIKKMLKNKSGKIINITSVVGHTGNFGQANYAASKAGLVGMSKSLALEYGKKNIKVNCVSPGLIKSEMTDKISESFIKSLKDKIPLERFGIPDDVANVVVFLCSGMSDYITGETIHVNGGMYFS